MKLKTILTTAMIICALSASAVVESIHETMDGIPSGFTLINYDGLGFNSADFGPEKTAEGAIQPSQKWYAGPKKSGIIDDRTLTTRPAVLSNSHRTGDGATDNWLITPQIAIKPGMVLKWDAKSIHFSLRENYDVMISETGTSKSDFKLLERVVDETYRWSTRSVKLDEYAGKNVYIAFVHNSQSKFLLALSELHVDVPQQAALMGHNTGVHFFAKTDEPEININIINHGKSVEIEKIEIIDADDQIRGTHKTAVNIASTGSQSITMPLDINTGEAFNYTVVATDKEGNKHEVLKDFANRSEYRRVMMIEKFTGTWCNACPRATFPYHYGMEKYHDNEWVGVEAHSPGSGKSDTDGYNPYNSPTVFAVAGDYPALWYNRLGEINCLKATELSPINQAELAECIAQISVSPQYKDDEKLYVSAELEFAHDIDNSDGHIRPLLVLVEKECPPNVTCQPQKWVAPGLNPNDAEFFFMPTSVPKSLTVLHNVVRSSSARLDGNTDNQIPAQIKAGEKYNVTYSIDLPDYVYSPENLSVVGAIVDASKKRYEIVNAGKADCNLNLIETKQDPDHQISIEQSQYSINEGERIEINATVTPIPNADENYTVTWTSSDENIVKIISVSEDGFTVQAEGLKAGNCTVKALASDGKEATCEVSVQGKSGIDETVLNTTRIVRDNDKVSIAIPDKEFTVTLTDILGRTILRRNAFQSEEISLPSKGIYLLTINCHRYTKTWKLM